MNYLTVKDIIGNTPLIKLQKLGSGKNTLLVKLEGNNPAGSVKDRPAYNMIVKAEEEKLIQPGDTLVEATSGNTGIALAMAAAIKGYKYKLIMPENSSKERIAIMKAYGAEVILTPASKGMEGAIDLADEMASRKQAIKLDQFGNYHNPEAHYLSTGPEIWKQTNGEVSHFFATMGTTGTLVGTTRYLKEKKPSLISIGVQPLEGANIPGIRKWAKEYLPKIYSGDQIDSIQYVSQEEAEDITRKMASQEGIFCGISAGGNVAAALKVDSQVTGQTLVIILPDRGDKYLSTGVFPV
ncbi:cysteine synthase CysM [Spirochaeta cellobiosiphila]|uniref:cysteine synthase CysM n=1 Tax=Spirochaeta cellobiosiphila TaxID=504483 RepID=UPI0003FE8C05|nr:cysteine synthase CysM [Spirochaeta cellobiosiphila]